MFNPSPTPIFPPHYHTQIQNTTKHTHTHTKAGHQVASLENWGGGLKSILWHANSPHTPSVQTSLQTNKHTDSMTPHRVGKKVYVRLALLLSDVSDAGPYTIKIRKPQLSIQFRQPMVSNAAGLVFIFRWCVTLKFSSRFPTTYGGSSHLVCIWRAPTESILEEDQQ